MPTIRELAAELGIPEETLTAKADIVSKWDGYFTSADARSSEAQKKLAEAQQLDAVINQNIQSFGYTEANVAQLNASNAAMKAAMESMKSQGFNGINIPDLPTMTPKTTDPMDDLKNIIANGFASVGQTLGVSTRYQRVFGQPLPDDPAMLADEAAKHRMSVSAYAEQKYGITAAEQKLATDKAQKGLDDYAAIKVKEYAESHASTAGHPELNGGMPSGYPNLPTPRDTKSVREFSQMSKRDKIASAMNRANDLVKSTSGAV